MALVEGINIGFVTTAPTSDPNGASNLSAQNRVKIQRWQAPSSGTLTELGCYFTIIPTNANVDFGIYSDNAGEPGTLLESNSGVFNEPDGWKVISGFSTSITSGTFYWIGTASTETVTFNCDLLGSQTSRFETGQTTFEATWDTANDSVSGNAQAMYALLEEAATGVTIQGIINITGVQNITL